MPLAVNNQTGEITTYWNRKYITKKEAMKMFPNKPKKRKAKKVEKKDG